MSSAIGTDPVTERRRGHGRAVAVVLFALATAGCRRSAPDSTDRPNVLLISIDTLRADRLGCYGCPRDTSPNMDRLAAEGVLFERCFSTSCKTTPSHMSIMTGLYPQAHDVYMWQQGPQGIYGGKALASSIPTLAETLKKHGYRNAAFTGGANVAAEIGFGRGFDVYDENDNNEAACRWLSQNGDQRFFVFYHTYYTHDPYIPPPPYDSKYDSNYSGAIPSTTDFLKEMGVQGFSRLHGVWRKLHEAWWKKIDPNDPDDWRHVRALYDGAICHVDNRFIRNLIETLEQQGVLDKTLIILTSDHGEEFLEHGRVTHDSLYREVTHVPLLMRWPERLPAGKRVSQLVRGIDIMPTILDLLDIRHNADMQGTSLLPAALKDRDLRLTAHADFNDYAPPFIESVRSESWFLLMDQRLRRMPDEPRGAYPVFLQLYDTAQDPAETRNLAGALPHITARMKADMAAVRIECSRLRTEREACEEPPVRLQIDAENLRRLKSLGYVK